MREKNDVKEFTKDWLKHPERKSVKARYTKNRFACGRPILSERPHTRNKN